MDEIICQIIEKSIKLNFEKHILFPKYLQKARLLQNIYAMGHKGKEAMINTFVHSNFKNYGLVFIFGTSSS